MFKARMAAFVVLAALLAVTGCGAGASTTDSAAPNAGVKINTKPDQHRERAQRVDEIAKLVPEPIRAQGALVVGTTGNTTPPLSFRADDDRTIIGVEPDIAQLVADVLGLRLDLRATSWENLFLSVETGQYTAGFSNITVTEERKDKYDFAGYRKDTIAFEVREDRDLTVSGPADLAGLRVGVSAATNQEQILLRWDERNKAAGLSPIQFQYYPNSNDYYLALRSGRIDTYVGPNPGAAYHAAVTGESKVVGTVSGGGDVPAEIAAMTKKGNGLAEALRRALAVVIGNGQYAEVLRRWDLASEAVPESRVNPPGLPRQK
ncbi:ABC transporter substrate-binding protein [Amycolatopsis anabasis]|uniref:ABC transporter substrate-binding protein n=1 Tax=Amycolatopsis anabasis TaxID=1840409 RepID=UPI001FE6BF39|nr:ABC transporter substrate-binding protein [Amycolatopsis anabasis]